MVFSFCFPNTNPEPILEVVHKRRCLSKSHYLTPLLPPFFIFCKGQLISKGVLMSSISSKKTNEGIRLYYYDTSNRLVFVRFLEEIEDTKKPFRNYLTFS